jgi:hypothetical protein
MNGILIAFTVPTGKNKTKSSAFVKAFYGQETSSHHGKYNIEEMVFWMISHTINLLEELLS